MFNFDKEIKPEVVKLIDRITTLSESERYILISGVENLVAKQIAKNLVRQQSK